MYSYKGINYLEQPDKTIVTKMLYNETDNVTTVYCKKPGIKIEFLASVIMLCCIFLNVTYLHDTKVTVLYSSIATYYKGNLYINLKNNNESVELLYTLTDNGNEVASGFVEPNETVIAIPISNVSERYTLSVSYKTLLGYKSDSVTVTIVNRDNTEGE